MNKPDWKDAPEWANWLAQDYSGNWFWYEKKPVKLLDDHVWMGGGRNQLVCNKNWVNSLEEKPHD